MVRSPFSIYGKKHTYLSTACLLVGLRHAIGRMSVAARLKSKRPKLDGRNRLDQGAKLPFGPVSRSKRATLTLPSPQQVIVKEASIERDLVSSAGTSYVRVAVTDHTRPLDDAVDRFIVAVRALPENAWAHFHCEAGLGRTTTFMVLYDMLRNATRVSLEDIVRRQKLLSFDYDVLRPVGPGNWKAPYVEDRIAFVRVFYDYARANPNGRPQLWSEWLKSGCNERLPAAVAISSPSVLSPASSARQPRNPSGLEARGVEPLSSSLSAQTSTCLSDDKF